MAAVLLSLPPCVHCRHKSLENESAATEDASPGGKTRKKRLKRSQSNLGQGSGEYTRSESVASQVDAGGLAGPGGGVHGWGWGRTAGGAMLKRGNRARGQCNQGEVGKRLRGSCDKAL